VPAASMERNVGGLVAGELDRPGQGGHQGIGAVGPPPGGELLQLGGEPGHPGSGSRLYEGLAHLPEGQMAFSPRTRPRLAPWGPARPAIVLVFYRRLPGGDQVVGGHNFAEMAMRTSLPTTWTARPGRPACSGTSSGPRQSAPRPGGDFACDRRGNDGRSDGSSPIRAARPAGAHRHRARSPSGAAVHLLAQPGRTWLAATRSARPARRAHQVGLGVADKFSTIPFDSGSWPHRKSGRNP